MLYSYLFNINREIQKNTANKSYSIRLSKTYDFLGQIPYHLIDKFTNDK